MEQKRASTNQAYHHGDLASELIRAAETELAEKDVTDFSLRAVAKRAGVSHAAPAHHFKDKIGLLTALAAVGYDRLIAAQESRQRTADANPAAQFLASGLGYIDFAEAHPNLFRLMFASPKPDRSDERFSNASMLAFNNMVDAVESLLDSNPYEDSLAMQQVMMSWSMVHGLAELIISGRAEIPIGFSNLSAQEKDQAISQILQRAMAVPATPLDTK